MPLDYQTILDTDLSPLLNASHGWKEMHEKFDTLHKDYRSHVKKAASDDSWRGSAVLFYKDEGRATEEEYANARDEAKAVASLLREAHTELSKYRNKLIRLKEEAHAACMVVTSKGSCSIDLSALEAKDKDGATYYRKHPKKRTDAEAASSHRIQKVVKDTREMDESFKRALKANPSDGGQGLPNGFTGSLQSDINVFMADEALKLAHKRGKMSDTQLDEFNDILSARAGNPKFSQVFAEHMGAKGTLGLWTGLNPYDGGLSDKRNNLLTQTRRYLGQTLGTASRSDSPEMHKWKQAMLKLGPERQGNDEKHSPYGYQVMSDLMHYGDYDDGFLDKYGNDLVHFERNQLANGLNDPHDLWCGHHGQTGPYGGLSNSTVNDWGNDPMSGLMQAMGRSPGASTDFFSDQDTFDYVVGGVRHGARHWPDAMLPSGEDGKDFSPLGHALQSASTGARYDDPSAVLHRGHDQVSVMHKVMAAYAGDYNPQSHQPGIGSSLGHMGAAYVDDLNYGLEDRTISAHAKGSDTIIGGNGHGVDPGDAVGFMRAMGRDPDGHEIMSNAQEGFTAMRIHHFAGTDDVYKAAEIGAQGHGALDESRAKAISDEFKDDETKRNAALADTAKWGKGISGVTIYAGSAALGAAAPEAAPILIPALNSSVATGANTALSNSIDSAVAAHQWDNSDHATHSVDDFQLNANRHATHAIKDYMHNTGVDHDTQYKHSKSLDVAYQHGRDLTDSTKTDG